MSNRSIIKSKRINKKKAKKIIKEIVKVSKNKKDRIRHLKLK